MQPELLEALPIAVYVTDDAGRITYFNQAAADFWGHRPTLGSDRWCGSWKLFWPDGQPMGHDECPMAETLRTGVAVRGKAAIAERPDGSRVFFQPFPTPLHDESGKLTGAINLLMDVSERHSTELELAKLAAIVQFSDDAIVSKTLEGRITSWNAGATRIFGFTAEEMIGRSITTIIPPELHAEEFRILAQLSRGEHIEHYETVRLAKDGRRVEISLSISPLRNAWGKVIGAAKVARDVTERKRIERFQQLLMEELNHRVKNTLATVQAIAMQSASRATNAKEFALAFSGRIQALARTHTLLSRNTLESADIADIVEEQVLLGHKSEQVSCAGPRLAVGRQSAVHLSLVLHELATNARKYGALSVPHGRLAIGWSLRAGEKNVLLLSWRETGGPKIDAPIGRGFGSKLIEETLESHGGNVTFHYAVDGLACDLEFPLPEECLLRDASTPPPWRSVARAAPSRETQQAAPLAGIRILAIEDEPLILMDLEQMLEEAGAQIVATAGTIQKAKEFAAKIECDVALLDSNLSGERVDAVAALLTERNIPFAFVTGYGREGLPEAFRDAPIVNKPFSPEQLCATIKRITGVRADVVSLRKRSS